MGKSGYDDTPLLPNSPYCVHDHRRPAPGCCDARQPQQPPLRRGRPFRRD